MFFYICCHFFNLTKLKKLPTHDLVETILNTAVWFNKILTHDPINPYHQTRGKRRANPSTITYQLTLTTPLYNYTIYLMWAPYVPTHILLLHKVIEQCCSKPIVTTYVHFFSLENKLEKKGEFNAIKDKL